MLLQEARLLERNNLEPREFIALKNLRIIRRSKPPGVKKNVDF